LADPFLAAARRRDHVGEHGDIETERDRQQRDRAERRGSELF
jgi:hypothetical protein